jgi:DNA-binding CsgD family transcriptional regulator
LLADLSPGDASLAAEALTNAGLLAPVRPLRFVHPLLLAAVRDAMSPLLRSNLHAHAARVLAEQPGGIDAACAHLLETDPSGSDDTVELLRSGAAAARARGASDAAVAYLRRALAERPGRVDDPDLLGELAAAAYATQEADALDLAHLAVARAAEPDVRMRAAINAGHLLTLAGQPRAAVELVLPILQQDGVSPHAAELALGLSLTWCACSLDARDVEHPMLDAVRGHARSREAPLPLRSVAALETAVGEGSAAAAIDLAREAWGNGTLLDEMGPDQPFVHFATLAAAMAGGLSLVDRWAERCIEESTARGSVVGRFVSVIWRAWAREAEGDLSAAAAYARESVELGERSGGMNLLMPLPVAILARAALAMDGPAAAAEALRLLPPEGRDPSSLAAPIWWLTRAAVDLADGRPGDALADLGEVHSWEARWPTPAGGWAIWRPTAIEAHLALGETEAASAMAAQAMQRAMGFGAARPLAAAMRATALVLPETARATQLAEALTLTDQGGCGIDGAVYRIDLARTHLAVGDATSAQGALSSAVTIADAAGATWVASIAADLLVGLGARPRRGPRAGVHSLTPAERRVVDLAVGVRSNRQIAERLFLTEKTVETHLTSAYRKLGIRSRTQLATTLARDAGADA